MLSGLSFRRVNDVCGRYITDDEAGRLTEMGVQKYTTDPKGKMDIDLYISTLEYNNDRLTLNIDQMRSEQRKLQTKCLTVCSCHSYTM